MQSSTTLETPTEVPFGIALLTAAGPLRLNDDERTQTRVRTEYSHDTVVEGRITVDLADDIEPARD